MAHCHIAEHHESGMMFSFDVLPEGATAQSRPSLATAPSQPAPE
jgi:hypothetical protein